MNVSKETIIRTIICAVALLNSVLVMMGKPVLDIGDQTLEEGFSILFMLFTSVWSWWKNNSFTEEAIKADEYMAKLKNHEIE